jgi:hypothetical protein
MDILAKRKTLTSQFLMPLLFEHKQFSKIISDYTSFVNAYIADFDKPQHDNKIIVVFKTKQKYLPELNRIDSYTKTIKGDERFIYVYDIPDDLSENYSFWLLGKYSQFTDRAKKIILNFWDAGEDTLLYGALYKKGDAIPKFYMKHFKKNINDQWTNKDEEWWITPTLAKEIYGTE